MRVAACAAGRARNNRQVGESHIKTSYICKGCYAVCYDRWVEGEVSSGQFGHSPQLKFVRKLVRSIVYLVEHERHEVTIHPHISTPEVCGLRLCGDDQHLICVISTVLNRFSIYSRLQKHWFLIPAAPAMPPPGGQDEEGGVILPIAARKPGPQRTP